MAQIIKHKRGNLEGLNTATTRAGELLVVTGSSGLGTIANGDSLLFVGIDGSTATPVNKILQGTTVPNLTGDDYNTYVDGIPFYDTDDNKLYILNKGGNIEVKATPETGGTGIVSGSSQVVLQDADSSNFIGSSSITTLGTISTGVWNGTAIANANLANDGITIDGADISLGGSVTTLQLGTSDSTALAGNTTTISSEQASAITANTAKNTNVSTDLTITGTTGARTIVSSDGTDAIIPIATTSVSGVMSKAIFDEHTTNNAKTGITTGQASAITANTAKISYNSAASTKLATIEEGAEVNVVDSVAGKTGAVTLVKGDVGLGNVTNESKATMFADAALTGNATAETQADNDNSTKIATTAYVQREVSDLLGGAPAAFDTLLEISASIANGDSDVVALTTTVGGKLQKDQNLSDLTDASTARTNLGVDAAGTDNSTDVTLVTTSHDYLSVSGQAITLGAITNDDLAGSIANAKLTNSSITIDGSAVSLGGSVTTLQLGTSDSTALAGNTTTITTGQASAITANTAKETNVSTNLSITGTTGARTIVSSDGDNAVIPIATTSVSGVMSKAIFDEHVVNNAKTGITTGQASAITANTAKVTFPGLGTTSSTALAGDTTTISSEQASAITANTAKVTFPGLGTTSSTALAGDTTTISSEQASAITANTAKVTFPGLGTTSSTALAGDTTTISGGQASAITANTAKVSATSSNVVSALSDQATDFGSGRVSGDNFGDVAGSSTMTGSFVGDGSGLTGVASTLTFGNNDVDSNSTVDLKTQHLDFVGTANEIETSISGQTVTIGIPTNPTLSGNVTVTGNLNVEGTTTTIDSTTVNIGDRILELNYARGAGDAGLLVSDVDAPNTTSGSLLWDGTNDYWKAGALDSEKELARLNASPTNNRVLKANSDGLLVDSTITDDGTDVSITGDLTVTGLAAGTNGAFLFADADEKLQAVDASTAGDIIQWNGSSFVASNTIDGGTF